MSSLNTETQEYVPTIEDIISLFPIIAGGWTSVQLLEIKNGK